MPEQVEQLATRFEALNDDVVADVKRCTETQWRQSSQSEMWPLAVVAHHIAEVNSGFAGMVERFVNGDSYTPNTSMDDIHEQNARHARAYANVGKPVVLDKLHASGSAVLSAIRKLDDEDLDRPAGVFGGNAFTIGQVIDYIVIGHTADHAGSIRATLDA